jgi:putative ABC transport system permease protein
MAAAVSHSLPSQLGRADGAYPRVYVGSDRGDLETVGVAAGREFVIAVSAAAGGVTLLIAVLVIAGSVGLSVSQRRRDIALLRAIAATPRQVRRMVVRELLAVGALAAAAGIWPGLYATHWLRDQFVSHDLVPGSLTVRISWLPPVVAAAATVLVAVVAGWIASLRASRIRPTEALAETSVERAGVGLVRAALGFLTLAGGVTLAIVAGSGSGSVAASVMVPAVFLFVASVAFWSPFIIRASAATFGRPLAVFGVSGQLALANATASARRLSAVVSSLVLAVALGGSMWFLPATQEHVANQQSHAGLLADYVVEPAAPGLTPSTVTEIARLPGVAAATGIVHSTLFSPKDDFSQFTALGADPGTLTRTVDLGVSRGSIADLQGNTIAVDKLAARALGLHVGSRFHGWFGDGSPAELRVVAVYTRGLGFAELTLRSGVLRAHTTSGLDDAVLIRAPSGGPRVAATLAAELDAVAPGSSVRTASAYQSEGDANREQNTWTNQLIAAVLLGYAVIASVNTLVMAGLARRREFAVLRLAGTTRLQVLRMVRLEQLLLLGVALVFGTAIAAITLVPTVRSLTGSAVPYIPPIGWLALVGGSALLTAAGVLPVRRALRMRPVVAIGVRE